MNRILVQPWALDAARRTRTEPRIAQHLVKVLRIEVGQVLRAALVGQGTCDAEVVNLSGAEVELQLGEVTPVARPRLSLVLAVPRPKALSRAVQVAASFGLRELCLLNTWRVDASYFQSHKLSPAALEIDALLGCEQGCQVHPPVISVHRYFSEFVETVLRARRRSEPERRWVVAHPGAPEGLERVAPEGDRVATTLVLGPDGGFIERELETFRSAGAQLAHGGAAILRTEAAVAAMLSQLQLLGRLVQSSG